MKTVLSKYLVIEDYTASMRDDHMTIKFALRKTTTEWHGESSVTRSQNRMDRLGGKKEQATDICDDVDEPQNQYAEWQSYALYDTQT